jgi:hypothetical protein
MQRLLHRRWRPGSITITAWQQQGSTIQFVLLHPQIDQPAQALHSHDEQRRTNTSKTSTRPTVIFYLASAKDLGEVKPWRRERESGSGCAGSSHRKQLDTLEQLSAEHTRCPCVRVSRRPHRASQAHHHVGVAPPTPSEQGTRGSSASTSPVLFAPSLSASSCRACAVMRWW